MAKERRKWDGREKAKIVLEGMREEAKIKEVCEKYKIIETQYYKWKEILLKNAFKAFESSDEGVGMDQGTKDLQDENQRLKSIVAEMALEARGIKV